MVFSEEIQREHVIWLSIGRFGTHSKESECASLSRNRGFKFVESFQDSVHTAGDTSAGCHFVAEMA